MKFVFIGLRKMKHKHKKHRTSTPLSWAFSVRFIFLSAARIFCNVSNQLCPTYSNDYLLWFSSAFINGYIYFLQVQRQLPYFFLCACITLSFIESFTFFFSLICLHKRVHHFYCGHYLHESLSIFSAIYAVCLV